MQAAPQITYYLLDLSEFRLKKKKNCFLSNRPKKKKCCTEDEIRDLCITYTVSSDRATKHRKQADISVYIHITVSQLQ